MQPRRTPVVPKLPKLLLRNIKPPRTPVVGKVKVQQVDNLVDRIFSDEELDAVVELASLSPESDPAWAETYPAMIRESCALFASEYLSGPKHAPYGGKFLLGDHHLEWDELLQEHNRLNILAARDHGKCRPAGSRVQAADGRQIPVEQWAGGEVVAFDEQSQRHVVAQSTPSRWISKSPCYRITTRTGRTDVVADRHRMLTAGGWRYGRQLEAGQRIAAPRTVPTAADQRWTPGLAWLLGLVLGDGGLTQSVGLTIDDDRLVDAAVAAAAESGWEITGGPLQYRLTARWSRSGSPLEWVRELGIAGCKSTDKHLPAAVLQLADDQVAEVLAGLLDSDGHVSEHGGGCVEWYSTSEALAQSTLHLLARLGIVAVKRPKRGRYNGGDHWSWRVTVRGESLLRLARQVKPRGCKAAQLRELAAVQETKRPAGSIDLVPHRGRWMTRRRARRLGCSWADVEVLWDEIIAVEYVGELDVYCIHVPGYETFVGEDLIHHNSYFFTFAYAIWQAGFHSPGAEGYIFSATEEQAVGFLARIKNEIETNPRLRWLLPGGSRTKPGIWSRRQITLSTGSVIKARGFGTKVRGGHPKWLVCDDVLNDDDIYSDLIRQRNVDYFLSAIAPMVHPIDGQIVVVGTPMHEMDLYGVLADNEETLALVGEIASEDLAGYIFECRKYPAIRADGSFLFPERYDERALKFRRIELKSAARFAREFLCQPLSDEASLFPAYLFRQEGMQLPYVLGLPAEYWERQGCLRYTGVDIAMSAETGGDYFIIFTIAVDKQGNRWIANIRRHKGLKFREMVAMIMEENVLMRSEIIHIEANQAQRVWGDEVVEQSDAPVRRFFTSGVGGRQPLDGWKKGATQVSVNKHHIDRGVPSLRMGLEHKKWRIPRGDTESIQLTTEWIKEMGSIGWIDGKVQSVGAHDDLVMACLPPGQLVTTWRGLVPIECVEVGDRVLTHRGRWRRVTQTLCRPYDGMLHSIRAAGASQPVRVTDNHPIWAASPLRSSRAENWRLRPGLWAWRQPQDLRAGRKMAGDYVMAPAVDAECPQVVDCAEYVAERKPPGFGRWRIEADALWWRCDRVSRRYFPLDTLDAGLFVGLYLAEGSCGSNGSRVAFALHKRETYVADWLRMLVAEQFGAPVNVELGEGEAMTVSFNSVIAHQLLSPLGKLAAKAMPWSWLGADDEFLAGVLRGWLVGDGSRQGDKLRGVSCSRNLIEQQRLIATRLGLRSALCPFSNAEPARQLDLDAVGTHRLLAEATAMEQARWGSFPVPKRCSNARTYPMRGELAQRIAGIERFHYVGKVYNLEVADDESYVVEGVAVHNCWMADTAARTGAARFDIIDNEADAANVELLASPTVSQIVGEEKPEADHILAERMVLAAVQQGMSLPTEGLTADAYRGRVRAALKRYAASQFDIGEHKRAARALQAVTTLDARFKIRLSELELEMALAAEQQVMPAVGTSKLAEYVRASASAAPDLEPRWDLVEGAPGIEELQMGLGTL